jgi:hypothetical protein
MTEETTDIVVEHADSAPETPATPEVPVLSAEEGIEDLKKRLAEEKAARQAAEQREYEARTQVVAAKSEVEDANLTLIKNSIETVKRDQAMAKANWQVAMESGDYKAASDAQEAGQIAAARLLRLEEGKSAAESRPKPQTPRAADAVEAFAATLTPRSAAWVRAHPECVRDARLNAKMIAAHNVTQADGILADTDEYFQEIENIMGFRRQAHPEPQDDPMAAAAQVTQRRAAPAAAPVSRAGMNGTKSNVIRLSADEREMASMMGMTEQDYAKNKADLIAAGRLRN